MLQERFHAMDNHERRSRLVDIIRIRGFAALDEIVRELGVSESTVRRDLDALEEKGVARRTHGGALYAGGIPRLAEFDDRQPTNWAAKRAIAAATAAIIADGETVLLDGGTTTYEVARLLVGRPLQVVTNSLPVANLFAETEQAMLRAAGRVIVVADGSKFGRKSLTLVSALDAINVFVSDEGLAQAWRDTILAAGAELLIAPESAASAAAPAANAVATTAGTP
jgi:DeoR/GlpR family transcriptional regulator of sugar metabolism